MAVTTLHELVPVLQTAVGPVILISGVGMLLLTMTNRFARTIDRARQLARDLDQLTGPDRDPVLAQVVIIYQRARVLRLSITLAILSVLLTAVLIIALFLTALVRWESGLLISLIFITGMGALIASLVAFLYDIHLSLLALKLELRQVKPDLS